MDCYVIYWNWHFKKLYETLHEQQLIYLIQEKGKSGSLNGTIDLTEDTKSVAIGLIAHASTRDVLNLILDNDQKGGEIGQRAKAPSVALRSSHNPFRCRFAHRRMEAMEAA